MMNGAIICMTDSYLSILLGKTALDFTAFAREMICEGFNATDPTLAQFDMPVEEFVKIFAPMKPAFIHHAQTKN